MTSPSPWSRPDDAVRQAQLDAMKRRATGLLALAAAVFAGASAFEGQVPWLGYVRATAEASLVGGLADWFAVTALFRHPQGADRADPRHLRAESLPVSRGHHGQPAGGARSEERRVGKE